MRLYFTIIFLILYKGIFSQNLYIVNENNQPIKDVNASYVVDSISYYLKSNEDGYVKIPKNLKYLNDSLIVDLSHINYHNDRIILNKKDTVIKLKEKIFFIDQVVVTGQIKESKIRDSQTKIEVINRDLIDAKAANTLNDILQSQLGIQINQDNILGSSINIQGISSRNIKILLDDIPIIGRLDGKIDLGQVNLNDIDRIEIVKGPLSVDYGTDALGGTINLISNKKTINNKV